MCSYYRVPTHFSEQNSLYFPCFPCLLKHNFPVSGYIPAMLNPAMSHCHDVIWVNNIIWGFIRFEVGIGINILLILMALAPYTAFLPS